MKIAIFASAFHPNLGGVEELVRQLAHALRRAGHEAIIVTQRWPRDLSAVETYEGLQVFRFPFRTSMETGPLALRLRAEALMRLTKSSIHRQIAALLQREGVELVHVQCVSTSAIYAGDSAQRLNLPLVVTLQGELTMDAAQFFQRSPVGQQLMRDALENADAITGCSVQTVAEAQDFHGRPFGARASVIYNGIRLADFASAAPRAHPRPYILGIGRHVAQKGFDILLRAYAQMKGEMPAAELPDLLLAGNGEVHEELKTLSSELKLDEQVHFVGRADRAGVASLFKGCDFFVLPSRHEPMGIVNLEAMAAGKAVVASNVGGVSELVSDGETGILVPGEDVAALAKALGTLCRDAQLRERLGKAGAKRVQQFDWDILTRQYLEIYQQAAESHSSKKSLKSAASTAGTGTA